MHSPLQRNACDVMTHMLAHARVSSQVQFHMLRLGWRTGALSASAVEAARLLLLFGAVAVARPITAPSSSPRAASQSGCAPVSAARRSAAKRDAAAAQNASDTGAPASHSSSSDTSSDRASAAAASSASASAGVAAARGCATARARTGRAEATAGFCDARCCPMTRSAGRKRKCSPNGARKQKSARRAVHSG